MSLVIESNAGVDSSMMETLFQQIITDLKASFVVWDEFTNKATKLHSILKSAAHATDGFLDSLQKVADMALGTRGATSDLGSALTRLCLRQRGLEDKMKSLVSSIMECLVNPLQGRMDEWKKMVVMLDKDHAKESKRAHQEMKKAFTETINLKKKAKKGKPGASAHLDQAIAGYRAKFEALEALEKNSVKMALMEERSRFCYFINCLNPVMDCQLSMLSETTHLNEIVCYLHGQIGRHPHSQQVPSGEGCIIQNLKTSDNTFSPSGSSSNSQQGSLRSSQSSSSDRGQGHWHTSAEQQRPTTQQQLSDDVSNRNAMTQDEMDLIYLSENQKSWSGWPNKPSSNSLPSSAKLGIMKTAQLMPDQCLRCHSNQCQMAVVTNPYAVPTFDKSEPIDRMAGIANLETNTMKAMMMSPATHQKKTMQVKVTPLTGYVNMNQLANLAVHENNVTQKVQSKNDDKVEESSKFNGSERSSSEVSKSNHESSQVQNKESHDSCQVISLASRGRSMTAEDILSNRVSSKVSRHGDTSSRNDRFRDNSLPPTLRKPSKTMSLFGRNSSSSSSPSNATPKSSRLQVKQERLPIQEEKPEEGFVDRVESSESPPPPPPPPTQDFDQASSNQVDDLDYMPLPPPPLAQCQNESAAWSAMQSADVYCTLPGLSSYYSLPDGSQSSGKAANLGHSLSFSGTMSNDDENNESENSFADSIRRGVKLRRTMTNDRSGPRLPSNFQT